MKYRKKPIVVEAYQTNVELDIETLEGVMHANIGDYIITGINGEKYPCKPYIFEKTYELVKENNYEMSKELQALERIKSHYKDKVCIDVLDDFDIIETALKKYEHSQQQRELYFKQAKELKSIELGNQKKLKTLEIIKEKKWLVEDILNAFIEDKEKCDLLKEVLL